MKCIVGSQPAKFGFFALTRLCKAAATLWLRVCTAKEVFIFIFSQLMCLFLNLFASKTPCADCVLSSFSIYRHIISLPSLSNIRIDFMVFLTNLTIWLISRITTTFSCVVGCKKYGFKLLWSKDVPKLQTVAKLDLAPSKVTLHTIISDFAESKIGLKH